MQFPDVTYRTADFSEYDAYFTLRGYQEMEQALEEDPVDGDWVGCILVKDNKFYFGSYEIRLRVSVCNSCGKYSEEMQNKKGNQEFTQNI